jgi:hypothetical protein
MILRLTRSRPFVFCPATSPRAILFAGLPRHSTFPYCFSFRFHVHCLYFHSAGPLLESSHLVLHFSRNVIDALSVMGKGIEGLFLCCDLSGRQETERRFWWISISIKERNEVAWKMHDEWRLENVAWCYSPTFPRQLRSKPSTSCIVGFNLDRKLVTFHIRQ